MKYNIVQNNPDFKKSIHDYLSKTTVNFNIAYMDAHKKAQEVAKKRKNESKKKEGAVSLSNTDTVTRATRIRAQLHAKLGEIFASDLDADVKLALTRDIMLKINNVEQKIHEIRRREKALQEERSNKKAENEQEKRRRQYDLQKRSIFIKNDYLYPAEEGGLDPANFNPAMQASLAAVSFEMPGISGEMMAVSIESNVEVTV